jgi:myo-inositol-1(or 4)-monophosphatase
METKPYLTFALATVQKAGKIVQTHYGKDFQVSYKGHGKNNLVTEVDQKTEKFIVNAILKKYPDHCVLGEEGGTIGKAGSPFRWIIDPIDGTTNFTHCYPFFAVSIGLEIKGKMAVGVIFAPILKELYYANKDGGAYLNGKKIQVSKEKNLETSLLATGFTYKNRGINLPNFEHFLYNTQGIRRCGAATLDLCNVAAGRLDGYWELGLKPWDIAAGTLILQEAGGKATNMNGTPLTLEGKNLLATNGHLHNQMLTFFKTAPELPHEITEAKEV